MPRFLAWVTEDKEDKAGEGGCWGIEHSLNVSDKIIYLRGGMAYVRGGTTGFHENKFPLTFQSLDPPLAPPHEGVVSYLISMPGRLIDMHSPAPCCP